MRTTNIGIFLIGFIVINKCVSQTIEICELPEKDSKCSLRCKTKDYNSQPVTFSHPPNHDVGSCIPPNQCGSNYDRYDLTQEKIGNENITYFHIQNLNRAEDEGKWICSYGNKPSAEKILTVHTRPENIDVTVNETRMDIMVNCSCYCVYPQESIRMEIEISNEDKKVKRRLSPLQSLSFARHNCLTEERTVIGTFNVQKEKWPGNFIDISCICTEEKLSHTQTENKRHFFHGVPKTPTNAKIIQELPQSVVVRWTKSANGGSMQTFVVLYKELSSNVMQNMSLQETENQDLYNVTLEGLKPETPYEVWIYAYNRNGNGSDIGPLSFTTTRKDTEDNLEIILSVTITIIVLIVVAVIVVICFFRRRKRNRKNKGNNHEVKLLLNKKDTSDKTESGHSKMKTDTADISLSEGSRMNIENTKALIKRITKTDFIPTGSYTNGINLLENHGILIYKGVYGDGRFTNAVHMLKHFTEKDYQPALIHDITKWDEIVNVNAQMVLLIPDMLSKLTIDKKLYERVYPYWEKIMGCVESGKTKVIMTCMSEVMNDIWFVLRDYDIFRLRYHIDLSDEKYKLTVKEKKQILRVHCQRNSIEICTDENEENYDNANFVSVVKISDKTISEIAETENITGFPQNSVLFCKHRKYTALGKNFFLRPTKCIVEDIDNLKSQSDKEKNLQYSLLKRLWFLYPNAEMFDDENDITTLESLTGAYVDSPKHGKYVLKHETIYVAVGLSIIKEEPERVIKGSNWNFFRYHIKPIKSKSFGDEQDDGTTFFIAEEFNDVVTKRCLDDLTPDSVCRYVKYVIECWPDNAERILNAIQTKPEYAKNKEKYLDIIQKSCQLVDEKGIYVQACMYGNILAIKELKKHFHIPEKVLDHCKEISKANLKVSAALDNTK